MAELDQTNIRYIQDGEPHDFTTYNRPVEDLTTETETVLVDHRNELNQLEIDKIVFTIGLG